ncbi:hypothetical protein QVD17_10608 [Tagetes erecta]|uniref:Uncharacterized protein n=1 Tax=Tagetes erecta TaxID=13708 RepID=A0AAD8L3A3_TARER|nr:hypothetical protein QVD17_10608 [Tagetes erecta]
MGQRLSRPLKGCAPGVRYLTDLTITNSHYVPFSVISYFMFIPLVTKFADLNFTFRVQFVSPIFLNPSI